MLENQTDLLEGFTAVEALYMLSFDKENKAIIKADKDKGLLENLHNSNDKGIQQAASGVIWEIEGKKEHISKSSGMFALSFNYLNNVLNRLGH